jgi:hypothetical protein
MLHIKSCMQQNVCKILHAIGCKKLLWKHKICCPKKRFYQNSEYEWLSASSWPKKPQEPKFYLYSFSGFCRLDRKFILQRRGAWQTEITASKNQWWQSPLLTDYLVFHLLMSVLFSNVFSNREARFCVLECLRLFYSKFGLLNPNPTLDLL